MNKDVREAWFRMIFWTKLALALYRIEKEKRR